MSNSLLPPTEPVQVNVQMQGGAWQFGLKASAALKNMRGASMTLSDDSGTLKLIVPSSLMPFLEDGDNVVVSISVVKAAFAPVNFLGNLPGVQTPDA